jgi:hypothetical protein
MTYDKGSEARHPEKVDFTSGVSKLVQRILQHFAKQAGKNLAMKCQEMRRTQPKVQARGSRKTRAHRRERKDAIKSHNTALENEKRSYCRARRRVRQRGLHLEI